MARVRSRAVLCQDCLQASMMLHQMLGRDWATPGEKSAPGQGADTVDALQAPLLTGCPPGNSHPACTKTSWNCFLGMPYSKSLHQQEPGYGANGVHHAYVMHCAAYKD